MKPAVLVTALLCLLFGPLVRAEPYKVVTEEWAPYNYLDHGRISGMASEIVRAIMARTGDDFALELLPSMRTTLTLQTRPKTIMFSLFRTPEREARYKWVGPIIEEAIHPYQLANSRQPLNSLEQLLHAPQITTRHAGLVPQTLEALGFRNLDKSVTESQQLYRMLLARRTEVIVGDTDAGVAYYSAQLNIPAGRLRQIPVELYRSSLYIAFSRDCDDRLVARWADALQALRDSGELARIQQRYEHLATP
ncbi:MAG: hypothetical protein GAK43_02615 [Stenotrophomonas maltophilia]|nr:MAG: hypothetical protein GAK43_02615 [Stenotrophomonas maltophilia]